MVAIVPANKWQDIRSGIVLLQGRNLPPVTINRKKSPQVLFATFSNWQEYNYKTLQQ